MRRALVVGVVLAASHVAAADPHKVLVLQSEGRPDAKLRQKIDAAIVKLAKTGSDTVTAGEINYSDAAAMVGCKPDDASCKDEVITTLAVDEIVIVNVTAKPGGLEVAVKRVTKGAPPREATTQVTNEQVDKLDAIAPLFGGKPPASPVGPTPPPVGPTPPAITTPPVTEPPPITEPPVTTPVVDPLPVVKEEPIKPIVVEPHDDPSATRLRRLSIGGMAGGGVMVLVGLVYWAKESGVQSDIDAAPTRTKMDLLNLKNLESEGDTDATVRTVFTLGGLVLGGVSTYFYIRARRAGRAPSTARLAPAVFDHGGGISLIVGGSP